MIICSIAYLSGTGWHLQIDIFLRVPMLILLPMKPSSTRYHQLSGVSYVGTEGVRWNLNIVRPEDRRKFSAARPDEIVIG